jgi:outer membrane receptor protein involved in Fe transport
MEVRKVVVLTCALVTVVFGASLVWSQGIVTGSLSATVLDPQGAAVAGATVRATQVETGRVFTTTSSNAGVVQLPSLPPGTYNVAIDAQGFSAHSVQGVKVEVGKDSGLGPVTLKLGGTTETVTVEGTAPLIESTTDQISQTFESKEVANVPLGNTYDSFVLFTPGVATSGSASFENNNGAELSINGQRSRSNNYQLDGEANNDTTIGGPSFFFGNQDAIAELQVVTNFDAEYGRNMGGVINYVTKNGTNNFHGTGYEFWQGATFDSFQNQEKSPLLGFCAPGQSAASGCLTPVIPRFVQNQWGGTIGGPIKRDKVWFFGSTNWEHQRTGGFPLSTGGALTPDAKGISQLQAAFPNNPAVAAFSQFGPATVKVGTPTFTNIQNVLVTNQVNPATGLAFPCSTAGVNGCTPIEMGSLSNFVSSPFNDREATGRVDFQLTSKDRFFTRYLYQFSETFNENFFGPAAGAAGQLVNVPGKTQQIGLDLTHTFNSSFLNQVRFSYSRSNVAFDGGGFPNCLLTAAGACPPSISFTGPAASNNVVLGQSTVFPQGRIINVYQVQDNASMVHGRQVIKFGGEYDRQRAPNYGLFPQNGSFTFQTAANTINSNLPDYSNFLANVFEPESTQVAYGQSVLDFKENDVGLYVQDDWRLKDNLTLNLGLRWDWYQQAANVLHNLSLATQTGPNHLWDPNLPLSLTTVPNLPEQYHNFGPVLGFAWTPRILPGLFGTNKTVIRGGFRIAYDFIYYNLATNVEGTAPFTNLATINSGLPNVGTVTGINVAAALFPLAPKGNPGFATELKLGNNFHNPYSQQWNLGLERQIAGKMAAEVRYVGNHTIGNFQEINGNPDILALQNAGFGNFVPAGLTPCTTPGAPGATGTDEFGNPVGYANCNFSKVIQYTNTGYSFYNGLQTQFRLQDWHGFTGELSYTWSKTIDNASEAFSSNSGLGTVFDLAQNPFDISRAERGNSAYDFPNLFNALWVYDIPYRRSQVGLVGHLLGGWEINGTYRYTSGQPWTPLENVGTGLCDPTNFTSSPSFDTCRPFLGNSGAAFGTVGECTNASAPDCGIVSLNNNMAATSLSQVHFILNNLTAEHFFGTPFSPLGRDTARGQPISTVNMGVFKNVRLTERVMFQFQAEAFNLFNHQWLGIPFATSVDAAASSVDGVSKFGSLLFNSNAGDDFAGNSATDGVAQRRLQFGGKIIF